MKISNYISIGTMAGSSKYMLGAGLGLIRRMGNCVNGLVVNSGI